MDENDTVETFAIPEDLTALSDADLAEVGVTIRDNATELAANPNLTDEDLARLETLGVEFQRVNTELTGRSAAVVDRQTRAQAAMAAFGDDGEGDADGGDDEESESSDESESDGSTAEAAVEVTTETITDAALAAAASAPVETPVARRFPTVEVLRRRRPEGIAPVESTPAGARSAGMTATPLASGFMSGDPLDIAALAQAITKRRNSFGNTIPAGVREELTMGTALMEYPDELMLSRDQERNFGMLEALKRTTTSLVASGGTCAPLAPVYDIFRMAQPHSPVESALPVVGAPRGGIRWITPPDFRAARSGIGVTTNAEDAAGYVVNGGPTANKPCVTVECPDVVEDTVVAVSQCVKFGNLNYRVFPEQVEAFLLDLAVAFAETKDRFYIDAVDAALGTTTSGAPTGSTHVDTGGFYGSTRSLTLDLLQAGDNYRLRNGMSLDASLELWLPAWAPGHIKADMVNDLHMGLGFLTATRAQLEAELRSMGYAVSWYYHAPTGSNQGFNALQGQPHLNVYPDTMVSYLFAPGTWARLDGGSLDVGLIRDSVLNKSNDLEIFSEQWIQVVKLGIESLRIAHAVCPNGTGPDPVTAFDCTGS